MQRSSSTTSASWLAVIFGAALLTCSACSGTGGTTDGDQDADMNLADMSEDDMGNSNNEMPAGAYPIAFDPAPEDWIVPLGREVRDAALLDANGDSILDIVLLTSNGLEVLEGDGRAGFTVPVIEQEEPADPGEEEMPPEEMVVVPTVSHILGADLDLDGNAELITCQSGEGRLSVFASGDVTQAVAEAPSRPSGCVMVGVGDLDGDGAQDVVEFLDMGEGKLGVSAWRYERISSMASDISALIASSQGPSQELGAFAPITLLVRDFDGDNLAEVLLAEKNRVVIFELVDGALRQQSVIGGLSKIKVLSAIDVDGDGDLDLHVGIDGDQDRLFLSDGNGRFAESTWSKLPVEDSRSSASVVLDLDDDGADELVMGTSAGFDRLYWGSHDGRLLDISPKLGFVDTDTLIMLAGDLDKDGDVDLVSVGKGGKLRIFARQDRARNGAQE